ncbi:MAG: hypothetical protein Q8Q76_07965 [Methylotenera sp.]|nr:hypothetical protein [Methylotenera sp.]
MRAIKYDARQTIIACQQAITTIITIGEVINRESDDLQSTSSPTENQTHIIYSTTYLVLIE